MPQPGLLFVLSQVTDTQSISVEKFKIWYESEHIPDVLKTSNVASAFRYKSIDPSAQKPYLAMYPVKDVNWLGGNEFMNIPTKSKYFKTKTGSCFEAVDFDTRYYEWVDEFEKPGLKAGPARLVISAGLTPAPGTDDDFNAWYEKEHYGTLAECPGYVRTRRYKLKTALSGKNVPIYLALHEFDCETLPQEELARSGETEWSKKIMGGLVGQEVGVYKLTGAFGDVKAKF